MSGLPWSKFFWSDYASDPALKLCGFAAQGLWMRLLCIAAEHDPVGYVAVNGKGLDSKGIARITGGETVEVEELLAELEGNSVFSRDRRGWIYSRRLINDAKKARNARENGKKGGNPKLSKQTENPASDNPPVADEDKPEPKPQKPEARVSEDKSSVGAADPIKELFDVGVSILTAAGQTEPKARSLIGKWRKEHGEEKVLSTLIACRTKSISNPLEWVTKSLSGASKYISASGFEYRGSDAEVLRQAERRADWDTYWKLKKKVAA